MKKVVTVTSLLFLLIFTACGQQLTKEKVVNKAFEKTTSSFKSKVDSNVTIKANGHMMNQSLTYSMNYIKKPFITHMKMSLVQGDFEMYLNEDYAYISPPNKNLWIKTPTDSVQEFANLASGETMKKELERMKKFIDLFQMEKNESNYVLTVNVNDSTTEKQKELVKDVLQEGLLKDSKIKVVKINEFNYKLTLDNNFNLKNITATADLDAKIKGKEGKIVNEVKAVYSDVNSVKDFKIPENIINNAVEQPK